MSESTRLQTHRTVENVPTSDDFSVEARSIDTEPKGTWLFVPAYNTNVTSVDVTSNDFNKHPVAVASFSAEPGTSVQVKVRYSGGAIVSARVRPIALGIPTTVINDTITFTLHRRVDIMLEINNNKYQSLHLLTNEVVSTAPGASSSNLWYFGAGLNEDPHTLRPWTERSPSLQIPQSTSPWVPSLPPSLSSAMFRTLASLGKGSSTRRP